MKVNSHAKLMLKQRKVASDALSPSTDCSFENASSGLHIATSAYWRGVHSGSSSSKGNFFASQRYESSTKISDVCCFLFLSSLESKVLSQILQGYHATLRPFDFERFLFPS